MSLSPLRSLMKAIVLPLAEKAGSSSSAGLVVSLSILMPFCSSCKSRSCRLYRSGKLSCRFCPERSPPQVAFQPAPAPPLLLALPPLLPQVPQRGCSSSHFSLFSPKREVKLIMMRSHHHCSNHSNSAQYPIICMYCVFCCGGLWGR